MPNSPSQEDYPVSPEDQKLFRQAMQGVTPMPEDTHPYPQDMLQTRKQKQATQHNLQQLEKNNVHPQEDFLSDQQELPPVNHQDSLFFARSGLQHSVLRRLRQGKITPEAFFDLHGLNALRSRQQLTTFITLSQQARHRCLLIIHGKGQRSKEQYPVLKNHVNSWLRQHPAVLAFCSAQARDGGLGAVYVLLKKLPPLTSVEDHF